MSNRVLYWVCLVSLLLGACVGGRKRDVEAERARLKEFILSATPKDLTSKLDVDFDGRVALLGYRVNPSRNIKPGSKIQLTMYWRLEKDLEPGWSLFTHVLDGTGDRLLNIDNVGPLREWKGSSQALPPSDWEVGKVYADEQTFFAPKEAKSGKLQVVAGVWKGDERLKVTRGAHDAENRAHVVFLDIDDGKKKKPRRAKNRSPRPPRLRVDMLDEGQKITIDGKLDEPVWRRAASTRRFVDVKTGSSNKAFPVNGRARLLYDETFLYVAFEVEDKDVTGGFKKGQKDPHLWTKDTVEIMVDPDGDGDNKDYYEIQINPQNLVFDSRFDDYNVPKGSETSPYGHEDWQSQLKSAVIVDGTLDDPKDEDKGYVVEARIPWKAFDKADKLPPDPGTSWRMNFYAMQNDSGVAWSPILGKGNFHKASRFGRVTWARRSVRQTASGKLNRALDRRLPKLKGALRPPAGVLGHKKPLPKERPPVDRAAKQDPQQRH